MTKKIDYKAKLERLNKATEKAVKNLESTGKEFSQVMQEARNNWGGKRANQTGRPRTFGETASETVGFKMPPSYAELLDRKRKENESRGQAARRLLLEILQDEQRATL